MKCPNCGEEIETPERKSSIGWMLPNLIVPGFIVGLIARWVFPFNVEHGYSLNYDMLIVFVLIGAYFIYLELYNFGKVKGTFVLVKKNEKRRNSI